MTYNLYIGADNRTKKVNFRLVYKTLDEQFEGYTVNRAVDGVWRKGHEQSCIVTVKDDEYKITTAIKRLKQVLHQEAIGVQKVPELEFI